MNAELEGKLEQLAEANADKENLLTSTEVGTIFLDLEKRIKSGSLRSPPKSSI